MANEAVIIELGINAGTPIRFTCGSSNNISKGTILSLIDPRTASGAAAVGAKFAGIASADKTSSDGSTSIACYTSGIFDLTSTVPGDEGAIQAGDLVEISGTNLIRRFSGANLLLDAGALSRAVGTALETAGSSEVIAVKIGSMF